MATLDTVLTEGVLVQIEISIWPGLKSLSAEDLGLKDAEADKELYSLGRKRLVEKERLFKFRSMEVEARRFVERHSFMFPIGKARFIPLEALPTVVEELERMAADFNREAEVLAGEYADIRTRMRERWVEALPGIHRRLKTRENFEKFAERFLRRIDEAYPDDVRARFEFKYSLFQVSLPEDAKLEALAEGAARELAKERKKLVAEKSAEMRREVNSQMNSFIIEVVQALRAEVAEVCGRTAQLISDGKPIRETSLQALRSLVDRFRVLNFVGDREIEEQINEVKNLLNGKISADFRDSEALLGDLKKKLNLAARAANKQIKSLAQVEGENFRAGRRLLRGGADGV